MEISKEEIEMCNSLNPFCDGAYCKSHFGDVKYYPLKHGGTMIFCQACFEYENQYKRGAYIIDWHTAKVYNPKE